MNGFEMLKFIGDALLVIVSRERSIETDLSRQMIQSARASVTRIESDGGSLGIPLSLSVGFGCHIGCHIGEVLYGDIRTKTRLDFMVMVPAVNLTFRLGGTSP
jgi:adenylate cyclase